MLKAKRAGTQPVVRRRNRMDSRCGWWAAIIPAAVLVLSIGGGRAIGLRLVGPGVLTGQPDSPSEPTSAILQPSEEAATLLARANEGIEREDWKLAIDSLQRIIELPGEHVLTSDGMLYESARRHAHRRIASLPPAGRQAYRLVYDGEASALLARARARHDPALLRTIVERYLMAAAGDEAAVILADWLIDEGRFSEASALLQHVRLLYPDSDLPAWAIPCRLAVCAGGMGQRRRAESILKELATTRPAEPEVTMRPREGENGVSVSSLSLADRIEQIRAYIARVPVDRDREQATRWPMALGGASRRGKMPLVEPVFLDHLPWTIQLPVTEPRAGFGAVADYARSRKLMPVRHIVTDGKALIVKGERELLALDVDSFAPIWSTPTRWDKAAPTRGEWEIQLGGFGDFSGVIKADPLEGNPIVHRLLCDSVGAGVAIAMDMALTVEWPNGPPFAKPVVRKVAGGVIVIGGVGREESGSSGADVNRVVAHSLKEGNELWKSDTTGMGGSGSEDSGPGEVTFLSVPIPVEGYLLAPCQFSSDLYAAVLDPKTGKLVRHVYLCGTGGGPFDVLHALEPCVADAVVFIPTGRGMLFALDASTWSILWAVRYRPPEGGSPAGGWLPTPVIAVADVVLLAPGDADELLCLDRGTGAIRWRADREAFTHLLGATDTHVWLAGEQVQLIEVETGRALWTQACGQATGRGVVSGDRLYLPTADGVVAMNALTGEAIAIDQPAGLGSLGNLLAWDGSLYSVGISRVRKFPDLARGYTDAVARHAADPSNASRAIRLAWLELLKHRPAEALTALAKVPDALKEADPRQYGQVAGLRVQSMLELAASGEVPSHKALELLREARAIAHVPDDAIRTALALGDHYRREGRPVEACSEYLSIVLSAEGDRMISAEAGSQLRARGVAVQKLEYAAKGLSEAQARTIEGRVREWLDEAIGKADAESLRWLAENPALGDVAAEAQLALGIWGSNNLRFEQAEGFFADALRRADSPKLRAEAAARLAAIYLEPAELHLPVSAVALLNRLEHEFAAVELPADILEPESEPGSSKGSMPAATVAATLRHRIDAETLAGHQAAMGPISLGAPGEATVSSAPGARPLSIRGERQEPLTEMLMTLVDGRRVEARSRADGRMLWPAELRLLAEPAVDVSVTEATGEAARSGGGGATYVARAVVDGQTLVVNSAYGLHAIGLLTGRRLWSRRFDPPCLPGREPSASDAWVWAHDGYLISVSAGGHLEVSRTTDGDRMFWRRSLGRGQWYAVRARGNYVVAVNQELQRVNIFRLTDGRYLGECRFTQDEAPGRKVNIALYDDVICGPVSAHEVAALELAAPGAERWRVSTPDKLSQVFKPTPALLAVADRSGGVKVIDPKTGKDRMAVTVYACEEGVVDGALVDGVLYVYGYQVRAEPGIRYDAQHWALAAITVQDNRILWQRSEIGARAHLTGELLRVSSDAIPVAVFRPTARQLLGEPLRAPSQRNRGDEKGTIGLVELTIVDKATGETIGETVAALVPGETRANRILDVQVWPGQVVVTAGSRTLRFPVGDRKTAGPRAGGRRADAWATENGVGGD